MRWVFLHTAEAALAQLLRVSDEEARAQVRDVVRDAMSTAERTHTGLEVWRCSRRWHRLRLAVERDGEDLRVTTVLPPHEGWRGPEVETRARPTRGHRELAHRLAERGVRVTPAEVRDWTHEDRVAAEAWAESSGERVRPSCLRGR